MNPPLPVLSGPQVDLIDHTPFPLETLYAFWHASRTDAPALTAREIQGAYRSSVMGYETADRFWVGKRVNASEPFHVYFDREVNQIAALDFPLKEAIVFSFTFSNVSITWREQAVRQRRATPWSQTSRTRDLANFVDNGWYEEPAAVRANKRTHQKFLDVINDIQEFYRTCREEGIHPEDARCLQPTCQTHRISFAYNARVLEMTMEDRLCFIAQSELWAPVIRQIREHVLRIDHRLAVLFHPPCVKNGRYRYCPVEHENQRRMDGRDPMGPCPLWAMNEGVDWVTVPLRANAEQQYGNMHRLWPDGVSDPVNDYLMEAEERIQEHTLGA